MEAMVKMGPTMNYLIYCTTTLVISFSLFYAYAKYRLSYWKRRGVKTPPTHFIFGNFKESVMFRKQASQLMHEIYDSADPDDPYIGFYIFHKPMLLLRDYELTKYLIIRNFDNFPNRRFGSANGTDTMGLLNLLATTSQPIWKFLRSKLTPALTGQKLKNMIPLIQECGKPMLEYIEKLPRDEDGLRTSDDVLEISSRYISDVLASLMFGVHTNSFNGKNDEFWQAGAKVFRGFKRGVIFIIYFFFPGLIPIIEPFITGTVKFFRECFRVSTTTREKMGIKRGDMIDFLLTLKNGEQSPVLKFEGDNLLSQAVSFYIAGFESTGTATAYAISQLAHHPEYQVTLYDEIQKHLSEEELNVEAINEMTFLDSFLTESLRLHPPLPVIDRITEKDFKVPSTGLVIEKGTPVYISVNATNKDPKYFSNPMEFNPLRIKTEKKINESLAFGIGPRSCIGQRLATIIMKVMLIMIISNYTLSYDTKKKNKLYPASVFPYSSNGLDVQFKKREINT